MLHWFHFVGREREKEPKFWLHIQVETKSIPAFGLTLITKEEVVECFWYRFGTDSTFNRLNDD